MPLPSYGVLKGNLYIPQEQTQQGNWFHGIFYVSVPGATYPQQCATDFSSATKDQIQYKIFKNLNQSLFTTIMSLPDGYTPLASNSTSGAIDYVRSSIFGPYGCVELIVGFFNKLFGTSLTDGWIVSDGVTAVQQLQDQLNSKPQKVFVFGEPYSGSGTETTDGVVSQYGMHNVHMNQGDPAVSSDGKDHQADDGIWQDGASFFLNSDGSLSAFCNKFTTQTFNTNDQGLPE